MNLTNLASILLNIITPIVLVALAGFVLGRTMNVDARPLSRATLYIFSPALVFTSAYRSKLGGEFITIVVYTLLITLLMGILTMIIAKVLRYDRVTTSAFQLGVLFYNAGNYGLPLMLFAFGEEGLARAVVLYTMVAVQTHTLAVFIAARGSARSRDALLNVLRLPLAYAYAFGLLFNQLGVTLPDPFLKAVELTGNATVPVLLTVLGIELSRIQLREDRGVVGVATFVRLIASPVVAFALAAAMNLTGVTRAVCIIQVSMPTAVFASILAVEFNARPNLVSGTVFLSTIGSIISLTILLALLM
ncbi:MAG: AEC family transporter [Chloroflexi bacterium]|nr:AEC family transporter [Chloroflexota bacterium]